MIYPTETEAALMAMTTSRNALAAECNRLVDALSKERQASADAREMLMGMGRELDEVKREADASRKLMVDALTAVVPGNLTEAIVDIARGRDAERVAAEKERDALRKAVGVTVAPAHDGGLT